MSADFSVKRQDLLRRWAGLKTERSSWMTHWQDLSDHFLPRSGRYFRQDRDRGDRRHRNIYDNEALAAVKTLGAGLLAGATSPARPWFRLATPDPDLNTFQPVKLWLDDLTKRMHTVYQKSNTYRAFQQMYEELGVFGTAASIVVEDFNTVIHNFTLTIGEYAIATDWKGNVCTIYREFEKQVSQLVKEFGYKNCSPTVQSLYDGGKGLDQWIPIIHAIEPREDRDYTKRDSRNMQWASYYFELNGDSSKLLRESGYRQFPAVVPRWAVAGGDIYGNSPGMEALGDNRQLQHEQLRKANAIDYQTNPPLAVPTVLKNQDVNRLPGGVTYVDPGPGGSAIKSAFEVNLNLQYLLEDIRDVRERIRRSFFSDMFLMLANSTNPQMTATEVAERHEEKLLMLGPVLERLNNELLSPLIETTFTHMLEGGAVPPPPQEMAGQELSVEFVSMLAQAQRAIGVNSVDRFVNSLGVVAQMKPDVLDKLDSDAWVDSYSDSLGVDPKLIVGTDQVAVIRQQRAKAQAAQAQAQMMEQASKTAKNLGTTPTGGNPNALQDMMNQYSGYGSPSPVEVQ